MNLSCPQRELLTWHWETILPPVIISTIAAILNCPIPMCHSFKLVKKKWQNPQVKQSKAIPEKEVLVSMNRYEAVDFVSADQFVANALGHVLSGFGRGDGHDKFQGGAVFQDAATGIK